MKQGPNLLRVKHPQRGFLYVDIGRVITSSMSEMPSKKLREEYAAYNVHEANQASGGIFCGQNP